MIWEIYGLNFVDCADVDATTDGLDIYGVQEHYVMDYSKPAGRQWTLKGYTMDLDAYPQDPRLHWNQVKGPKAGGNSPAHSALAPQIRNFLGGKFMYVSGSGYLTTVYRFNGEVAVPAGMFSTGRIDTTWTKWPPNQPASGGYIWRDTNGNGAFDAAEYAPATIGYTPTWPDNNGNLYGVTGNKISKWPMLGLDGNGFPMYSDATRVDSVPLSSFTEIMRYRYQWETDRMYVSGYTAAKGLQGTEHSKAGRVLACYPKWSGGNRTASWEVELPYDLTNWPNFKWGQPGLYGPNSFTVAGDYVFVVFFQQAFNPVSTYVYNATTGAFVGDIQPGAEVLGNIGDIDMLDGVSAYKRSNGEYLIFREDNRFAKVVMFRWRPGGNTTTPPAVPAVPTNLTATSGDARVTLSWKASSGAASYNIYRGTTDWRPKHHRHRHRRHHDLLHQHRPDQRHGVFLQCQGGQ